MLCPIYNSISKLRRDNLINKDDNTNILNMNKTKTKRFRLTVSNARTSAEYELALKRDSENRFRQLQKALRS